MTTWRERRVDGAGVDIHVGHTALSPGMPAVILAHGFSDNGRCWGCVAAARVERFAVVLVDSRNHGRSGAAVGDVTAQADDLAEVIADVGFDRPHVVGHSMGAAAAAVLAAQRTRTRRATRAARPAVDRRRAPRSSVRPRASRAAGRVGSSTCSPSTRRGGRTRRRPASRPALRRPRPVVRRQTSASTRGRVRCGIAAVARHRRRHQSRLPARTGRDRAGRQRQRGPRRAGVADERATRITVHPGHRAQPAPRGSRRHARGDPRLPPTLNPTVRQSCDRPRPTLVDLEFIPPRTIRRSNRSGRSPESGRSDDRSTSRGVRRC